MAKSADYYDRKLRVLAHDRREAKTKANRLLREFNAMKASNPSSAEKRKMKGIREEYKKNADFVKEATKDLRELKRKLDKALDKEERSKERDQARDKSREDRDDDD